MHETLKAACWAAPLNQNHRTPAGPRGCHWSGVKTSDMLALIKAEALRAIELLKARQDPRCQRRSKKIKTGLRIKGPEASLGSDQEPGRCGSQIKQRKKQKKQSLFEFFSPEPGLSKTPGLIRLNPANTSSSLGGFSWRDLLTGSTPATETLMLCLVAMVTHPSLASSPR